jgi:hypothetical protein
VQKLIENYYHQDLAALRPSSSSWVLCFSGQSICFSQSRSLYLSQCTYPSTENVLFGFLAPILLIFSSVYNFSSAQSGLPFIGIAVECLLSLLTMSRLNRTLYQKQYRNVSEKGRKAFHPNIDFTGQWSEALDFQSVSFCLRGPPKRASTGSYLLWDWFLLPRAISPSLFPVFYTL